MIWDFDPVAFSLLGLDVRWYGLSYVFGFFIVLLLGYHLHCLRTEKPLSKKTFENGMIGLFVAGVIGGRVGFFLFYHPELLLSDPLEIFKTWHGGMSIHGGLGGAIAFLWWWSRRVKTPFWALADTLVVPLALSLVFGRVANFLNGELVGRPTGTDFGVYFLHIDDQLRHPSQLYEALKSLILFLVLITFFVQEMWKKRGFLTAFFFLGYGVLRFIIEQYWREPDGVYEGLSTGQWLCIAMVIFAFSLAWSQKFWYTRSTD